MNERDLLGSIDEGLHHVFDAIEKLRRDVLSQLVLNQLSTDVIVAEIRKLREDRAA